MPQDDAHEAPGSLAAMLLYWVAGFLLWHAVAGRWEAASPMLARWYAGMVCALVTASGFSMLAARLPESRRLAVWGATGALVVVVCSLWLGRGPWRLLAINVGVLAATFCVGALLGELVESVEYAVPMLFAASVDAALWQWGGFDAASGALRFPVPVVGPEQPFLAPSELILLAAFLRGVDRLRMGPSHLNAATAVGIAAFCLSSGAPGLEGIRCPLMLATFVGMQWICGPSNGEAGEPAPSSGRIVAFGLVLIFCTLASTLAPGMASLWRS